MLRPYGYICLAPDAPRKINKKSVRQMLTWAHYRFKQIIKHQADKNGSIVVDVSEAIRLRLVKIVVISIKSLAVLKCSNV
jgi:hypothetical protein